MVTAARASAAQVIDRRTGELGWRASLPHVRAALEIVGQPGSAAGIPTPAAVLDLPAVLDNIECMQERARRNNVNLRPHAKTHKCAAVAELQLAAGAAGICCAKLGEAEALSKAGLGPILVTSPVADRRTAERLRSLLQRAGETMFVVDHPVHLECLDAAGPGADRPIGALVDVDVGLGRTGVVDPATAVALARDISDRSWLRLEGVQGYGGHWQHQPGAGARLAAVAAGMERLSAASAAIEAAGFPVPVRTGGGTGTFEADTTIGVLNDLQPGSYVTMDVQYRTALGDDVDGAFAPALTIHTQVVSANQGGWVTVDAGYKAFATDADPPTPWPPAPGLAYEFYGDEHGMVVGPGQDLRPGDRLRFLAPHCDPTIDRYDVLHVVDGDTLVGIVPVTARGRSQ
jgi:D-serine deaminase-like pyridoxal phosphate-dependent protein